MVAYNLLLSLFPLALLALFIAGRVLQSGDLEHSVLSGSAARLPERGRGHVHRALQNVRNSSTGIGIVALVASVWIGSSFWGALDTAFCRIYHVDCRTWLQQKRFSVGMLLVVLAFMATTVIVPAAQSLLVSGAKDLPFGLDRVEALVYAGRWSRAWRCCSGSSASSTGRCRTLGSMAGIWPGASARPRDGTVDYAFPAYLTNISTIGPQLGSTFVFILIVLLWFYRWRSSCWAGGW